MIAHITLSSIPERRKAVLRAFIHGGGNRLSVKQVETAADISRHTVEGLMKEMAWLGFGKHECKGAGKVQYLHLAPEWQWVASEKFSPYLVEG